MSLVSSSFAVVYRTRRYSPKLVNRPISEEIVPRSLFPCRLSAADCEYKNAMRTCFECREITDMLSLEEGLTQISQEIYLRRDHSCQCISIQT